VAEGGTDLGHWSVSWSDLDRLREARSKISGLKMFQQIVEEELPRAPFAMVVGFRPVEVAPDKVKFRLDVGDQLDNGAGLVHGGAIASLLDIALAAAAQTQVQAGETYLTVNLSIEYINTVEILASHLECVAEIIEIAGDVARTEAVVYDPEGQVVARGSSKCKKVRYRSKIKRHVSHQSVDD